MVVLMRNTLLVTIITAALAGMALSSPRGEVSAVPDREKTVNARPDPTVVEITAERFAFTPSEIRTRAGTTLQIRLKSDDTAHGFRILDTDVNVQIPKRGKGVATITFVPKAGRYTFECSRLCGAGHSFMRGTIVATE
jgi:cytochrome c oxidase subunit II